MLETITMSDLHINKLKISSFFSKLKILKKKNISAWCAGFIKYTFSISTDGMNVFASEE